MMKKALLVVVLVLAMASMGSATVSSCDAVNYETNGDKFDGEFLSCSVTSDETASGIVIDESASGLSDALPDGEFDNGFSLRVSEQTSFAEYGFRQTGMLDIWKFEHRVTTADYACLDSREQKVAAIEEELAGKAFDISQDGTLNEYDYYAAEKLGWNGCYAQIDYIEKGEKLANIGEIESNPSIIFETTWSLDNGETTYTKTITNGDVAEQEEVTMADGLVQILWTGSKTAGETAPVPTDELIGHSSQWSESFRILSRSNHDEYTDRIPGMADRLKDYRDGLISEGSITHDVNRKAEQAATEMSDSESEFTDTRISGSSIGEGVLQWEMPTLRFPSFQVYMDVCSYLSSEQECSALLSIKKSVGVPGNLQASSEKFKELGSGIVDVSFDNVGDGRGSFSARLENCGSDFSVSDSSKRVLLDPGDTADMSFQVSLGSDSMESKELSATCDVSVKELTSLETISDTVTVTAVQQNECEPGDEFVKVERDENGETYETVRRCVDGLNTERILTCEPNERVIGEDGDWQCKAVGDNVNVWVKENGSCVEETHPVSDVPDDAFTSKASCEGEGQVCLIDEEVVPGNSVQIGCFDSGLFEKGRMVVVLVLGIIGAGLGLRVGRAVEGERKIGGSFNPVKSRSVSRQKRGRSGSVSVAEVAGLVLGLGLGVGLGWYLGYWALLVGAGLLLAKYLLPFY